jgi:uncharacterized membrane protein YeaQ/YmgE (transglycosylase-associated protein family)
MTLYYTVFGVNLDPGGCFSWIVVSLVAGWLAGTLVRGRGFGCLGDIALGLIGGAVGVFILYALQVNPPQTLGFFGTLGVAFLGAFVLALIGRLLGGSRRTRSPYYREWRR